MIRTWKHKGLRELFETGATRRIEQVYIGRCQEILAHLNGATKVGDMAVPGYNLHNLKPNRPSTWVVKVSGPWRVTFTFKDGNAYDVDLEQYH